MIESSFIATTVYEKLKRFDKNIVGIERFGRLGNKWVDCTFFIPTNNIGRLIRGRKEVSSRFNKVSMGSWWTANKYKRM